MFGFFAVTNTFSNVTDINLKQVMFEQRMKEIEDDVVPFGFMEDGLDQAPEPIVDPRSGWSVDKDWRNDLPNY
jgi:hypothetical protein